MAKLAIHPVGLVVIIFGMLVWIIALGGVGAATYSCQKANSYEYCAKAYQWEWWSIWFEFALLVSLFICCFIAEAFRRGRMVFLAFFVLATQCVMWSAHEFITQITIGAVNIRDVEQDAVNAASAGLVLLGLVNFALIIVLGKDFGYEAAQHYQQTGNNIQFQTSAPV